MMPTICLAMIVKDEAAVIGRCLASVRPYITRWVVCDTGSNDDTGELVLNALHGLRGELYQDAWSDFAANRTLSIERARRSGADYILILDADEELVVAEPAVLETLSHDAYVLREHNGGVSWLTLRLVRASLPWRYEGVIHEDLRCEEATTRAILDGVSLTTAQDGHRSQNPDKVDEDILVMQAVLEHHPLDAYRWFHLGLACRMQGRLIEAAAAFERRLSLPPLDAPECWQARYLLAGLYPILGQAERAVPLLLQAYGDFPACAEPLYRLGRHYLAADDPEQAYPYLELAASKPAPALAFLREDAVYDYLAPLYLAVCELRMGREGDAQRRLRELLDSGRLSQETMASAGITMETVEVA